jgi:hypothetical protein
LLAKLEIRISKSETISIRNDLKIQKLESESSAFGTLAFGSFDIVSSFGSFR